MSLKCASVLVVSGGILFVPLGVLAQTSKAAWPVEIFVAGRKYSSLADYHDVLESQEREALIRASAVSAVVNVGPGGKEAVNFTKETDSPEKDVPLGVPYVDEKGWKTIRVAPSGEPVKPAGDLSQKDSPDQPVTHYVAGIGMIVPAEESQGGASVRKVRSIKELNDGLVRQANTTTDPLLVVTRGNKVQLLKLTRKFSLDQPADKP